MTKRFRPKLPEKGKYISAHDSSNISSNQLPPIFSLYHIKNKKYCLSICNKEEKSALVDTIFKLSQIPWKEIQSSGRHASGHEIIKRQSIKTGIPSGINPDVTFIAFRFYAKASMVGFRDNQIFHIVWIDSKFILYKH